ncbi:MAG: hypothetical protein R2883_05930 [Caldisericia bacterium]
MNVIPIPRPFRIPPNSAATIMFVIGALGSNKWKASEKKCMSPSIKTNATNETMIVLIAYLYPIRFQEMITHGTFKRKYASPIEIIPFVTSEMMSATAVMPPGAILCGTKNSAYEDASIATPTPIPIKRLISPNTFCLFIVAPNNLSILDICEE